jgi:hypothetical protein
MKLPNWVKILPEEKLQNWYLVFSEIKPDLKQAWDVADQHWLLQLQTLLLLWQTASLTNFTIIEIPNVVELDTSECNSAKPWNGMTCFKFQLNHTSLCRASSLSFNSFTCFWKDFCHSSICTWPRPFQLWEPWLDKVLGLRKQITCSVKHAFKSYWERFHNTNDVLFLSFLPKISRARSFIASQVRALDIFCKCQ